MEKTKKQEKQYLSYDGLTAVQKRLLDSAEEAMDNAYSPYSRFCVGAALLMKNGEIMPGANYENVSYGLTICAERAAIVGANARGQKKATTIAIIARGEDFDTQEPTAPCGACRQVIKEIADVSRTDIEVIYSNTAMDKILIEKISELLPGSFGPADIRVNLRKEV